MPNRQALVESSRFLLKVGGGMQALKVRLQSCQLKVEKVLFAQKSVINFIHYMVLGITLRNVKEIEKVFNRVPQYNQLYCY
jgi:hypothetical protein